MKLPRFYDNLDKYLRQGKVLVIFGPRQVGKTTLIKNYLSQTGFKYRLESGEDFRLQELFLSNDLNKLKDFASDYALLVIDEAQQIKNIGMGLKLLIDHTPDLRIIVTGSSSFELAGQIGEPLTGRKTTLTLYPVAQLELIKIFTKFDLQRDIDRYLIYGSYPEIITAENNKEKIRLLNELSGSYIFKDILELDKVKSSKVLVDLLRLLAFQIGNEVSFNELGNQLGITSKTVARYLDLFEKSFVLFNLRGFSRNLRKEITKKGKYYFFDTGLRNAVISNFNSLELRNDTGMLWENFLVMERVKKIAYREMYGNLYFWRTWSQQEVDLVEERDGNLFGYEFKWKNKKTKPPRDFIKTYSEAKYSVIDKENYMDFIT